MLPNIRKLFKRLPLRRVEVIAVAVALVILLAFGWYMQYTSVTVYTGTLPCADCAGIKTTLTLEGNHTYSLSSLYIERGNPYTEKGTWQEMWKNNLRVYQLKNGKLITYYQIVNPTTIKMLDGNAHPINAPFSLELKRE